MLNETLDMSNRTETLFAVYNFLEKEFGFRWLKPGDDGIFCIKTTVNLLPELSEWTPALKQRNIRVASFTEHSQLLYGRYAPKEFALSEDQLLKKQTDLYIWLRRMRLGRSEKLNDGINTYFLEWHKLYRLTARIDDFYSTGDFDITDSYLKDALNKNISEQAKQYLKRMQVSNQQSRLTYLSFLAGKSGNKKEIIKAARELVDFRIRNKDVIDINWNVLFQSQHYQMDDQIGTRYLGFLPDNLNSDDF